jgi:hypothetical protein
MHTQIAVKNLASAFPILEAVEKTPIYTPRINEAFEELWGRRGTRVGC